MDYQLLIVSIVCLVVGFLADTLRRKFAGWRSGYRELDWLLETAAGIAVKAAEQMFGSDSETNELKLQKATEFVVAFLAQRGIKVSDDVALLIRAAIEAAVLELKKPGE